MCPNLDLETASAHVPIILFIAMYYFELVLINCRSKRSFEHRVIKRLEWKLYKLYCELSPSETLCTFARIKNYKFWKNYFFTKNTDIVLCKLTLAHCEFAEPDVWHFHLSNDLSACQKKTTLRQMNHISTAYM